MIHILGLGLVYPYIMSKPGRELARSDSGRAGEKPEPEWRAASQLEVAGEPQNGARPELLKSSVQFGAAREPTVFSHCQVGP